MTSSNGTSTQGMYLRADAGSPVDFDEVCFAAERSNNLIMPIIAHRCGFPPGSVGGLPLLPVFIISPRKLGRPVEPGGLVTKLVPEKFVIFRRLFPTGFFLTYEF